MSVYLRDQSVSAAAAWLAPGLLVSILALVFTVASFWWLQARRGKLLTFPPRSYAGYYTSHEVRLVFPLVLYNTGPVPIVVLDFRLRVDLTSVGTRDAEPAMLPSTTELSWYATQPRLEPAPPNGGRTMPSPFPVAGRQALERFIEFGRKLPAALPLDAGPYPVTVDALLAHHPGWQPLVTFLLHTELVRGQDSAMRFIVRTNDPSRPA